MSDSNEKEQDTEHKSADSVKSAKAVHEDELIFAQKTKNVIWNITDINDMSYKYILYVDIIRAVIEKEIYIN